MDQRLLRLVQVLKDFVPELQKYSDEELYNYTIEWTRSGHKGKLKDFISKNKVLTNKTY